MFVVQHLARAFGGDRKRREQKRMFHHAIRPPMLRQLTFGYLAHEFHGAQEVHHPHLVRGIQCSVQENVREVGEEVQGLRFDDDVGEDGEIVVGASIISKRACICLKISKEGGGRRGEGEKRLK